MEETYKLKPGRCQVCLHRLEVFRHYAILENSGCIGHHQHRTCMKSEERNGSVIYKCPCGESAPKVRWVKVGAMFHLVPEAPAEILDLEDAEMQIILPAQHECIQRDNAEALIKSKKGGRVPAALKQKFTKDSKTIPSLIYHAEKYEQGLYALEQKAKVNLLAGTKLSTARDFRIEVKELKEALAENHTETQMKKKNKRDTTSVESNDSTNYSTMQQSGISNVEDAGESSSSSNKGRKSLKRKRNNK